MGNPVIASSLDSIVTEYNQSTDENARKLALAKLRREINIWRAKVTGSRAGDYAVRQMLEFIRYLARYDGIKSDSQRLSSDRRQDVFYAISDLYRGQYINPTTLAKFKRKNGSNLVAADQAATQKSDYLSIQNTLAAFDKYRVRLALFGIGRHLGLNRYLGLGRHRNAAIYTLTKRLYEFGLHGQVAELYKIFKDKDVHQLSEDERREQIEKFFYEIYFLFHRLNTAKDPNGETKYAYSNENLTDLKQAIHAAAREFEIPLLIYKKQQEEQETKDKAAKRKYAVAIFDPKADLAQKPRPAPQAKKRNRKLHWLTAIAITTALIVGIGQGLLAAVLALTLAPLFAPIGLGVLVVALIFGISGFLVNSLLFYVGIKDILKLFFDKPLNRFAKLFKDEDGNKLNRAQYGFIGSSLFIGLGSGAAYGFLTYFAVFIIVGFVTSSSILTFGLPIFFAAATAIAYATLHTYSLTNFVGGGYRNFAKRVKENFVKSKEESWGHYLGRLTFNGFFLAIALFAIVVLSIASFGFMHAKSMTVLTKFIGWGDKAGKSIVTGIFVDGLAFLGNTFFKGKILFWTAEAARVVTKAIFHPQKTWRKFKNWFKGQKNDFKENPFRDAQRAVLAPVLGVVYIAAGINGAAYGEGFKQDGGQIVSDATRVLPLAVSEPAIQASGTAASGAATAWYSHKQMASGLAPNMHENDNSRYPTRFSGEKNLYSTTNRHGFFHNSSWQENNKAAWEKHLQEGTEQFAKDSEKMLDEKLTPMGDDYKTENPLFSNS